MTHHHRHHDHRPGRHIRADALRIELRRPAWRWSFLTATILAGIELGPDLATAFTAGVALYAWWPRLRRHRT